MRGRIPLLLTALLSPLLLGGCAGAPPSPPPLPLDARIDRVLNAPEVRGVHWGILLVDPASGDTLYARNPDLRFVPASNMKIPVTLAALELLGPEYRWKTALFTAGELSEDGLSGDLILPALGDPSLGAPFHDPPEAALRSLVDSLAAVGVTRVDGRLLVDLSAWDSTTVPGSWLVGNLNSRSGATGGAFAIRTGELEISLVGGEVAGVPADISWHPYGDAGFVENRVVTALNPLPEDGPRASFLPESRRWVVEGSLRPGEERGLLLAVRDPVGAALATLERELAEGGVQVLGGVHPIWDPGVELAPGCRSGGLVGCEGLRRVAGIPSPDLMEVAAVILKPSQNWIAEQTVRTLGWERGGKGSWAEGFAVLTDHLTGAVGVDSVDFHFRDGSGLAAYNLLTPRAVVTMLEHAARQPWGMGYRAAMPAPGERFGTLSGRLAGLESAVLAKTGSISHVNTLSGYLLAPDGRELLFSILTNAANLPAVDVRNAIDRVVREMADPWEVRSSGLGAPTLFRCDPEGEVRAHFTRGGEVVILLHPDRGTLPMTATPAASGVRYTTWDGAVAFHTRGSEAFLEEEGEVTLRGCRGG